MDKTLIAENLHIVDKNGETRACLGVDAAGEVGLYLWDRQGKARAFLGILASGQARLHLRGPAGELRARLGVEDDGSVEFTIHDSDERQRGSISSDKDGNCSVSMNDADKRVYLESLGLFVREGDECSVVLSSSDDRFDWLKQETLKLLLSFSALRDLLVDRSIVDEEEYKARLVRLRQETDQLDAASRDAASLSILKRTLKNLEKSRTTKDDASIRTSSFELEVAVKRWLEANAPVDELPDADEGTDESS